MSTMNQENQIESLQNHEEGVKGGMFGGCGVCVKWVEVEIGMKIQIPWLCYQNDSINKNFSPVSLFIVATIKIPIHQTRPIFVCYYHYINYLRTAASESITVIL